MKTLKAEPISKLTLLLLLGVGSGDGTNAYAQELRDMFHQVKASVVTVRINERESEDVLSKLRESGGG